MKEKLKKKIDEILNYIMEKPIEQITNEEYSILSSELRDIRYREGEEERNKKYAELMTTVFVPSTPASVKENKKS